MRPVPASLAGIALLAAWLGAVVLVAAVVAPAAFAVLPTRTLAGALVGRVLPVVFWSGIAIGVAVTLLGWGSPEGRVARTSAALVLAGACAIAQLGISPRIAGLRDGIGGPIDLLSPSDPRRQAFGRLHGLSVAFMGLGGLAALVALILIVRVATRRTP